MWHPNLLLCLRNSHKNTLICTHSQIRPMETLLPKCDSTHVHSATQTTPSLQGPSCDYVSYIDSTTEATMVWLSILSIHFWRATGKSAHTTAERNMQKAQSYCYLSTMHVPSEVVGPTHLIIKKVPCCLSELQIPFLLYSPPTSACSKLACCGSRNAFGMKGKLRVASRGLNV